MRAVTIGIGLLTVARSAAAQEGDPEATADKTNIATVSVSPLHLYIGMVEATSELNARPHLGLGLILGAGRASDVNNTVTGTAYEAGLQINWYPFAAFSGAHLGVEGTYVTIGDVMEDPHAEVTGLSVGSFVGYKLQTDAGLALIAQGGVQYIEATGHTSTQLIRDSAVAPLLNLNAGWSF